MTPKTVLMLTSDDGPGGIRVAIGQYAVALAENGVAVTIAAPGGRFPLPATAPDRAATRVVALPSRRLKLRRWAAALPSGLETLAAAATVVMTHNNRLAAAARPWGRPVIAVCHSDDGRGLEAADRIIALSSGGATRLQAAGIAAAAIRVIPHFLPPTPALARRAPTTAPVICGAGRLVAKKGFDTLLHAAARLRADGVAFALILGGTGPEAARLQRLAARLQVPASFPGWREMRTLLSNADIFCLPSRREPFGLVLGEAMMAALPCVASAVSGPCDLITDGVNGLLSPPGDAAALATALRRLLTTPQLRRTLGDAARATVTAPPYTRAHFNRLLLDAIAMA